MPGGPFFNCYPGPFSNVRCNFTVNGNSDHDWGFSLFVDLIAAEVKKNLKCVLFHPF